MPIVLKAISRVVQSSSTQQSGDNRTTTEGPLENISSEIILESVENVTLECLQALVIFSVAEYGSGRLGKFYNLISVCKR